MKKIKVNKGGVEKMYHGDTLDTFRSIMGRDPWGIAPTQDSNWGAVQQEREEKNTQLEFFIMDCGCGTQTMVELEYQPDQGDIKLKFQENKQYRSTVNVEVFTLECPGCGFITEEFKLDCSPDGVTIRILESWIGEKTKPKGLGRDEDLEHELEERTRERDELFEEVKRLMKGTKLPPPIKGIVYNEKAIRVPVNYGTQPLAPSQVQQAEALYNRGLINIHTLSEILSGGKP